MESTILSLNRMAEQVRKISNYSPSIGLVLGTGFSNFVSRLENPKFISFKNIPGMPVTTNPAHKGEFVIGRYAGITFIVSNGRVHNYEGYTSSEAVTPIRVMGLLGIRGLILTNAAGALNPKYRAGDLMIIEDYISSFVPSPLIGENIDELGTRFPDMSNVFDKEVTNSVYEKAIEKGIAVKKGVYIQFRGPQYESRAESKFARMLGADSVGMSTTTEAIAAAHMGLKVCGFSLVSNSATGVKESDVVISDDDVIKMAIAKEDDCARLIELFAKELLHD